MITYTIPVDLAHHAYPVYIGEGIYHNDSLLKKHIHGTQVLILSNNTLAPLYLEKLQQALSDFQCDVVLLPDGEQHKNLQNWETVINTLAEKHHHRDSTLVNLGGGVIGDMGGFAAGCYQRGIPFIQIPTTLLAQVDASIGGKTAINHPAGKNLVGVFNQPQCVIIDTLCLKTLPEREFRAGLAEIVKAALILDGTFFEWIEKNYQALLTRQKEELSFAIASACTIKKDIVTQDEKESGVRMLLNLGHTFGHAIENSLGYGKWLHGEAVAVGLVLASRLSLKRQQTTASDHNRIEALLKNLELPTQLPQNLSLNTLIEHMKMDKKVKRGKMRFVLLNAIGSASLFDDITDDALEQL